MTDPDLQAAHEEALRQIKAKFEGASQRIFQEAIDEYDRQMRRVTAIYVVIILVLLVVIAVHISQMPPNTSLPT